MKRILLVMANRIGADATAAGGGPDRPLFSDNMVTVKFRNQTVTTTAHNLRFRRTAWTRPRKFVWASAEIVGNTVVVSSPQVSQPLAVRYGWADCPVVNLWNKDGLPASPFRTDDFPLITAPK